jgi:hypothetical protein
MGARDFPTLLTEVYIATMVKKFPPARIGASTLSGWRKKSKF